MPLRRRRTPTPLADVDPAVLPARYRPPVADALNARTEFSRLVAGLRPGPLQERVSTLGERVDAGVLAVWRAATHAAELERVVAGLDPERVTAELKRARREGADPSIVDPLAARFASTQRLLNSLDDLRQQLPVLHARLATAVAQAAELALTSPATSAVDVEAVRSTLDGLVLELDALNRATAALP